MREGRCVEAEAERGLVMRILLHSPKDMVAGLLAAAAVSAIIANALFLQAGRHPSPMFGTCRTLPAPQQPSPNPLPRPRPVEAAAQPPSRAGRRRGEPSQKVDRPKTLMPEADAERRSHDQSGVKATSAPAGDACNVDRGRRRRSRSPAQQPPAARRVAAVQRALTEYGYGQLKPTGTIGADTQAAIQKFERERKLPVTGQMSDRLVRELAAMIGRPID